MHEVVILNLKEKLRILHMKSQNKTFFIYNVSIDYGNNIIIIKTLTVIVRVTENHCRKWFGKVLICENCLKKDKQFEGTGKIWIIPGAKIPRSLNLDIVQPVENNI